MVVFSLLVVVGSLHAYTPVYSVKKAILASDVHPGVKASGMTLTGFTSDGLVAGYLTYPFQSRGVTTTVTEAFAWDDPHQTLTNFTSALQAVSSMATCAAPGTVAGVYWTHDTPADPARQLGFVWHGGQMDTFAAPGGADIDTVTSVSSSSCAVGTYYGDSGLKRAFLWYGDDTNTLDLGDLGDPANSFVWPQAVNNAPQVVGTIYMSGEETQGSSTTAFRWLVDPQTGAISMSAVDGTQAFTCVAASALNDAGQILGSYLKPHRFDYGLDPGPFFWDNHLATDLATLAGGGLSGFSLGAYGRVTGTGFATDRTLHLYDWTTGNTRRDLGPAFVHPNDQSFQFTSVSESGQITGKLAFADNTIHASVWSQGQMRDLASLVAPAAGFTPGNGVTGGPLVDDAGQVACPGTVGSALAVCLLTPDADGDGLPDGWEMQYFHHTGVDPSADDDGDGLTNLQEYQSGTDPTDFYNGQVPTPALVSGGNQRGDPGTTLPQPVAVQAGYHLNAPLHFAVTSGGALLAASPGGPFTATVDLSASGTVAAPDGSVFYGAQVYVHLPGPGSSVSTLTVSTSNAHQTTAVTTTAVASDPSLPPPTGLGVASNTATTVDLQWSPADGTRPTAIEVSYDQGASWRLQATFDPGTTAGTVYHLLPDHVVWLRAYTAAGGGGGGSTSASGTNATGSGPAADAPGGPAGDHQQAEDLSVPVVEGQQVSIDALSPGFPGYNDIRQRYLHATVKQFEPSNTADPDLFLTIVGVTAQPFVPFPALPPPGPNGPLVLEFPGAYYAWTTLSDASGFNLGSYPNYPGDTRNKSRQEVTLDHAYDMSGFPADAASHLSAFDDSAPARSNAGLTRTSGGKPAGSSGDDGPPQGDAWLHLTGQSADSPPVGYTPKDQLGIDGPPSARYQLAKLRFKFRCNADPQGHVVYDVVFTPDDGSPVLHDIQVLQTHGQTRVGQGEDNDWILLDPTGLHSGANGKYQVVPIQLQPDDWKDPDSNAGGQPGTNAVGGQPNDLEADPSQSGNKGSKVDSILKNGTKHFVSPKKAGDLVWIRAQVPADVTFAEIYEWQPGSAGGTPFVIDANKIGVPRDTAGHFPVVLLRKKQMPSDPDVVIDTYHVWVVWCDVSATFDGDPSIYSLAPGGIGFFTGIDPIFTYQANINPRSICNENQDVPDLRKRKADTPHYKYHHAYDGRELGQVPYAWNLTRQWRERDVVPVATGVTGGGLDFPPAGAMFGTLPNDNIIQTTSEDQNNNGDASNIGYPKDEVEGNDDYPGRDLSPYGGSQYGIMTDVDRPKYTILYAAGHVSNTVELHSQFREFVRLNLGDKWYKVSDYAFTRYQAKFSKISEVQVGQDVDGDGKISHELWIIDAATNGFLDNENF